MAGQGLEEKKVVEGRTEQSVKERFRKVIMKSTASVRTQSQGLEDSDIVLVTVTVVESLPFLSH